MPYGTPFQRTRAVGGGAPMSAAPQGAAATMAPTQGPTSAATPAAPNAAPQVGTGFVGFDRYFNANKQGAQNMANTVAGTVQGSAQGAQNMIQGASDTFDHATADATLTYDHDRPQNYTEAQNLAGEHEYKGPKTLEEAGIKNTGEITDATVKATGQVNNLGTVGGRADLLRESYRNGSASTSGGSLLDAALTGQAGGGRFAELQGIYGGLSDKWAGVQAGTTGKYEAGKATTAASVKEYADDLPEWQMNDNRGNPQSTGHFLPTYNPNFPGVYSGPSGADPPPVENISKEPIQKYPKKGPKK